MIRLFAIALTMMPPLLTASPRDELVDYLRELPASGKIISGQHNLAGDETAFQHNRHSIREIHAETGHWVGIYSTDIGIFLEGAIDHTPPWWGPESLTKTLLDWHAQGGIVELVNHQASPEKGNYKGELTSLKALLDETIAPAVYEKFWKRTADAVPVFQKLEDAGVPVLWRPFHEMNADWFWWGDRGDPDWSTDYAELWQRTHDFYVQEHGLDNLIWVYSPDGQTDPEKALEGWPGDEYVDVVGIDFYNSFANPEAREKALTAWNLLRGKEKPMGITEVGPFSFGTEEQNQLGTYHYVTDMLEPVQQFFPEAAFFVPWYHPWIPTENAGAQELYDHPNVLHRGEIALGGAD